MYKFLCIAAASLLFLNNTARADDWPRLDTGNSDFHCKEALKIAKYAFQSQLHSLALLRELPADNKNTIILSRHADDISGGGALNIKEGYFDIVDADDKDIRRHNIFWQKADKGKVRLVLDEYPVGWRGDMYSLYVVNEDISQDTFKAIYANKSNPDLTVLIKDSWNPPLIMESPDKGIWGISMGQPYEFLSKWKVIIQSEEGIKSPCTIHFRPNVEDSLLLLPKSVEKLGNFLLDTIGDGKDEGTLQPTAHLKIWVQNIWANAALRPWAINREAYNTRAEVDEALSKWAKNDKSFTALYNEIYALYPTAQEDLAAYYSERFKLPSQQAKKLAIYIMDIALRSHYSFHSEDENSYFRFKGVNKNPWESFQ